MEQFVWFCTQANAPKVPFMYLSFGPPKGSCL
jgi:hypothetical protein